MMMSGGMGMWWSGSLWMGVRLNKNKSGDQLWGCQVRFIGIK
jgi:hypothetical protein